MNGSQSGNPNHLAFVISFSNDFIHFQWKRKEMEKRKNKRPHRLSFKHHILLSASSTEMFIVLEMPLRKFYVQFPSWPLLLFAI